MEENNKVTNTNGVNKVLLVLVVILLGGILILGGYILGSKDNSNNNNDKNVNENNINNNNNNSTTENNTANSQQELINIGNKLYNYGIDTLWCRTYKYSENYVADLGWEILNYNEVASKFTIDNKIQHNIYEDYKQLGSYFKKYNEKVYDGSQCGRGANQTYISTQLEIVENKEEELIFNAVSEYCDQSLLVVEDKSKCNKIETKTHEFIIKKENNVWKIDKITVPN